MALGGQRRAADTTRQDQAWLLPGCVTSNVETSSLRAPLCKLPLRVTGGHTGDIQTVQLMAEDKHDHSKNPSSQPLQRAGHDTV